MSSQELHGRYVAALSRITGSPKPDNVKRFTPIFQRAADRTEKQAVRDAANALSALWKVGAQVKR